MNVQTIKCKLNPKLVISVTPGHFATRHSHNSRYIDITRMKHEHDMAREAAMTITHRYAYTKEIDTIVCTDGSEVIGAFLAYHMTKENRYNVNAGKHISVVTPEYDSNGQMIFRDNLIPMISGKSVLLLISTVNSGKTIRRLQECAEYYGAEVQGIASVFSSIKKLDDIPVYSIFTPEDIPGYSTSDPKSCPMCKAGQRIDALANSYGLSKL